MPRWSLRDLLFLVLVVLAAGGARSWYLLEYCDSGQAARVLRVQGATPSSRVVSGGVVPPGSELDELVANLTSKREFAGHAPLATKEERTAHVAPGYYWVAALITDWTESPVQAHQVIRW